MMFSAIIYFGRVSVDLITNLGGNLNFNSELAPK